MPNSAQCRFTWPTFALNATVPIAYRPPGEAVALGHFLHLDVLSSRVNLPPVLTGQRKFSNVPVPRPFPLSNSRL